jgi:sarcosine oxidase delta subunit
VPMFRRLRMLRSWGGIVDVTPDRSPIIGKTPVARRHVHGCGRFFNVARNTMTDTIVSSYKAGERPVAPSLPEVKQ